MNQKIFIFVGVAVLALIVGAFLWLRGNGEPTSGPETLVLAAETSLLPATVWVAEAKGYFRDEGLDLEIRDFDSGRNALETMLRDKSIHVATAAQTPVVFNSFSGGGFQIFATMAHSEDDVKILARKDLGITTVRDLLGKKIGVTLRSTGHYFLEGFLAHHGYSLRDVQTVDVDAAKLNEMLAGGELDAITTWEPHIYTSQQQLGKEKLSLLLSPTAFRKEFYFVVRLGYGGTSKAAIQKFLRAVIRAEAYIKEHEAEARAITAKRLQINPEIVAAIWDAFTFEITLDQSMLVSLEDEARWAIRVQYMNQAVPNYLDYILLDPLAEVRSSSVTIIR